MLEPECKEKMNHHNHQIMILKAHPISRAWINQWDSNQGKVG